MLSKIYPLTAYTNILWTLNVKFKMAKRKKQKYYSILRTIFSNWNILFGLELTTCLSNVSQNPLVLNGDYPVKSLERLPPSSSKNPTARPCATGDRIFPTYLVFRPPWLGTPSIRISSVCSWMDLSIFSLCSGDNVGVRRLKMSSSSWVRLIFDSASLEVRIISATLRLSDSLSSSE